YLTQQMPPALVETLPPIVDHGELAASGGYQAPCSRQAVRRSSLTTPGCTTASCSRGLIYRMEFIRSSAITTPLSKALAPPDRPVPAPRGTTGTPASAQTRTAAATCSVVVGRTTASGLPYGAHSASSCA